MEMIYNIYGKQNVQTRNLILYSKGKLLYCTERIVLQVMFVYLPQNKGKIEHSSTVQYRNAQCMFEVFLPTPSLTAVCREYEGNILSGGKTVHVVFNNKNLFYSICYQSQSLILLPEFISVLLNCPLICAISHLLSFSTVLQCNPVSVSVTLSVLYLQYYQCF